MIDSATGGVQHPLLRLADVGKTFQMGEVSVEVLCHISFDVHAAELLVDVYEPVILARRN